MCFCWCWEQFLNRLHLLIDPDSRTHYLLVHLSHDLDERWVAWAQEPIEYVGEDAFEGLIVEWGYVEQREVPHVPHGGGITTSSWWEHSCNKYYVLQVLKLLRLQIIPTPIIHPLPQQLNWRLCTVLFLSRHIHIINKYHYLCLTLLRPIVPLPSPNTYLRLYGSLTLVSCCLPRKCCLEVSELGIEVVLVELAYNVDSLPCARLPRHQHMNLMLDIEVEKMVITYGIISGY